MTSPLTFSLFGLVPPCVSAGPMTITPFETTGAELLPILPIGSIGARQIQLRKQIDRAVLPELANRHAGLRVERDQLESRSHGDDPGVRAIGPVRDAAADLARRLIEARAFIGPPRPQRFTGARIDGNHVAPRADREVEDAVGHDRRRLAGAAAEVVELPAPRHLEILDVVAIDLIVRARSGCCRRRPHTTATRRPWPPVGPFPETPRRREPSTTRKPDIEARRGIACPPEG